MGTTSSEQKSSAVVAKGYCLPFHDLLPESIDENSHPIVNLPQGFAAEPSLASILKTSANCTRGNIRRNVLWALNRNETKIFDKIVPPLMSTSVPPLEPTLVPPLEPTLVPPLKPFGNNVLHQPCGWQRQDVSQMTEEEKQGRAHEISSILKQFLEQCSLQETSVTVPIPVELVGLPVAGGESVGLLVAGGESVGLLVAGGELVGLLVTAESVLAPGVIPPTSSMTAALSNTGGTTKFQLLPHWC